MAEDGSRRDGGTTSRPYADIIRANVFTRFNAILGVLLVVILIVGPFQDSLFGIVLVTNTLIGIAQEVRAKRSLDRLALLTAPKARRLEDGVETEVPVGAVRGNDVLAVHPGDQIVVDGVVLTAEFLEVDESLLTGEAEPIHKREGDGVLSGSFVVAGSGSFRAEHVGEDSYARRIAAEAKTFQLVRSELRDGINVILRLVSWLLPPVALLLIWSQVASRESVAAAIRGSVAGVGSMIPEGLVLLTSVAFAAGALRLARRRVLVQELAAVEILARVDVVCLDKTGTLTAPELTVTDVRPIDGTPRARILSLLAAGAGAEPAPNATMRAITRLDVTSEIPAVRASVPFSSARKWSAIEVDDGWWVLGAPDVVVDERTFGTIAGEVRSFTEAGDRVVLIGRAAEGVDGEQLPAGIQPVALVVLAEELRSDARTTIEFFRSQGITIKLISGDHPSTVAAIATRVGIDPGGPIDARDLPSAPAQLAALVETGTVFGRVNPHQKRDLVAALQSRGHVVAMTGDGVNDILALKAADLGVAMASGSAASRAVAPVVLLDNSFSALPAVLAEGRRVVANVEQVANLFLTKTVYATLLALAIGVARLPFPFLPRHLTIISSLTIGIPAFFLALAPNARRARSGFVARVFRFAIPAGIVAGGATFLAYALARSQKGIELADARTAATAALFGVGLWVLAILARPLTRARLVLVGSMAAAFVALLLAPPARSFFELHVPGALVVFAVVGVVAVADLALEAGWRLTRWLDPAGRYVGSGRDEQD